MRDVKRFPTTTGLSWLEMSSFKEHLFKGHEKIGKEYDYVIVGGGYGGYGCASRLAELQPEARIAVFEAIKIGNGDSGKNAGFIIDVPHNFGDQGNSTFEDNEMYYKLNTFIIGRSVRPSKTRASRWTGIPAASICAVPKPRVSSSLRRNPKSLIR